MACDFRQRLVDDDRACCFALRLLKHGVKNNDALLGLDENVLQVPDSFNGAAMGTIDEIFTVQEFVRLRCRHQAF